MSRPPQRRRQQALKVLQPVKAAARSMTGLKSMRATGGGGEWGGEGGEGGAVQARRSRGRVLGPGLWLLGLQLVRTHAGYK